MIVATIDIGTNTILLLIARIKADGSYDIIEQHFSTPRLGEGVDKSGIISEQAIIRATDVLRQYKQLIIKNKVEKVVTNATSAMRDALNNQYVKSIFENILNSKIEIISSDTEAYYSYIGAINSEDKSALLDIGGGSTEIMIGEKYNIIFRKSFQIGTVRFTERIFNNISPISASKLDEASNLLKSSLASVSIDIKDIPLYSVAGTPCAIATSIKGLADYEVDKIDNTKLYKNDILKILNQFSQLNAIEIANIFKITPKRADVITAGALILYTFLDIFSVEYTIVSSKGLRFGILQNLINSIK